MKQLDKNEGSKKGRKPNNRRKGKTHDLKGTKGDRITDQKTSAYGGNDVSWYNRNPELLSAAAHIPFPYVPGRTIPVARPEGVGNEVDFVKEGTFNYQIPGLMTLDFYPTVGYSTDIGSPINISAREVYARIRSKYSGSLEADAPDIMMYMLALDSMYMFIEDLKRAYYTINLYSPYNLYYPKAVVQALGYDWQDLYDNRNLFYQYICEFILKLNRFMVPDRMDLFKRHMFMCGNIYADSPETKSQHYMFNLRGVYKLTNTESMTKLEILDFKSQFDSLGLADIAEVFYTMYDALALWDTGYTINGYLERAFEGETFLTTGLPVYDGVIVPVYNPEILLQIQNATAVPINVESLKVFQDPAMDNVLYSQPSVLGDPEGGRRFMALAPKEVMLSIPSSTQPDPYSITIATRLSAVAVDYDANNNPIVDTGTEVVTSIRFSISLEGTPMQGVSATNVLIPYGEETFNHSAIWDILKTISVADSFRYHPTFHIGLNRELEDVSAQHPYSDEFLTFIDADNVTKVDKETLRNLHRVCVYSEFNCFH